MSNDIEIEIDGKKLAAQPNQTVIQVADAAGIYIPRFCYHKHLSIPANCRMCLVEVEKSPKALPACATPVMPGMKVFTKSQKTIAAQRAVMEFLLINHPLDCPICDQGGECELQDLSMGYGKAHSDYNECKKSVADENLGPLVATEMTRCIKCTRCVRFGEEIAGMRELGVIHRGGDSEIGTYVEQSIKSEVSGNIIDLCPVGALTSKPYRFTARAWELDQAPSISPHDCVGTNIHVHTRYGKVMRVVARENAAINETWVTDRDRFAYTGLYHADRLKEPIVRVDGEWRPAGWEEAFNMAVLGLRDAIAEFGADKLGALASPNSTLEEFYLLQKITHALGTPHIDHRLRDVDTADQAEFGAYPGLGLPISELEQCDAIILIGSNLQKEQPLLALRARKASLKGAAIIAINPMDYQFNFNVTAKKIVAPQQLPAAVAEMTETIAVQLQDKKKIAVIMGALAQHHPEASKLRALAQQLANKIGASLSVLTEGANSAGAWLAGAIPHRHAAGDALSEPGLSAQAMFAKPRKAYLLLNVEPDVDCANATQALAALQQAACVVAFSMYRNPVLEATANVIFPVGPFTETSGTYVNAAGEWQSFAGVAKAFAESRPAWKVLRVLGNFLGLDGFNYESSEEVRKEVESLVSSRPASHLSSRAASSAGPSDFDVMKQKTLGPALEAARDDKGKTSRDNTFARIGEIPIYATDAIVRRAEPLQATQTIMEGDVTAARLHPESAKKLGLANGDKIHVTQHSGSAELTLLIDKRVPAGAIWIAGGIAATHTLGDLFGNVEIKKC